MDVPTQSVGVTLVELADLMRRVGAWQAMNFDGGGSTTMVVNGALMNKPTDPPANETSGTRCSLFAGVEYWLTLTSG